MKVISKISMLALLVLSSLVFQVESMALTISGFVYRYGVPARRIILVTNNGEVVARTDENGAYTLAVPASGTYLVTPYVRQAHYTVFPLSRLVTVNGSNVTNVNFDLVYLSNFGVISGYVATSKLLPGMAVHANELGTVYTDSNGIYTFSNVPPGRYFVSPISQQYTFNPGLIESKVGYGQARSLNFRGAEKLASESYVTYLSGLWSLNPQNIMTNCPVSQSNLDGIVSIDQYKSFARIDLPRLGRVKVPVVGDGFSGHISTTRFLCMIDGDIQSHFPNSDFGTISGSLNLQCLLTSPCQITFSGTLARN